VGEHPQSKQVCDWNECKQAPPLAVPCSAQDARDWRQKEQQDNN
jgi:hypothetical protein